MSHQLCPICANTARRLEDASKDGVDSYRCDHCAVMPEPEREEERRARIDAILERMRQIHADTAKLAEALKQGADRERPERLKPGKATARVAATTGTRFEARGEESQAGRPAADGDAQGNKSR